MKKVIIHIIKMMTVEIIKLVFSFIFILSLPMNEAQETQRCKYENSTLASFFCPFYNLFAPKGEPCKEPSQISYVCGSDGKTYNSTEQLECQKQKTGDYKLYIRYTGSCRNSSATDTTLSPYGSTFPSLRTTNASTEKPCREPSRISYVCGSDGKTYNSPEQLECHKQKTRDNYLRIAYRGICQVGTRNGETMNSTLSPNATTTPATDKVTCRASRILAPVCGSDGLTYNNTDLLNCAKLQSNSSLSLSHFGRCEDKNTTTSGNNTTTSVKNTTTSGNNTTTTVKSTTSGNNTTTTPSANKTTKN